MIKTQTENDFSSAREQYLLQQKIKTMEFVSHRKDIQKQQIERRQQILEMERKEQKQNFRNFNAQKKEEMHQVFEKLRQARSEQKLLFSEQNLKPKQLINLVRKSKAIDQKDRKQNQYDQSMQLLEKNENIKQIELLYQQILKRNDKAIENQSFGNDQFLQQKPFLWFCAVFKILPVIMSSSDCVQTFRHVVNKNDTVQGLTLQGFKECLIRIAQKLSTSQGLAILRDSESNRLKLIPFHSSNTQQDFKQIELSEAIEILLEYLNLPNTKRQIEDRIVLQPKSNVKGAIFNTQNKGQLMSKLLFHSSIEEQDSQL